MNKIEIAARFDHRNIHAGCARVGNDKNTAGFADLARFVVDDPITNTCFGTTEILAWKLISLSGTVVVNRICAVDENAESHLLSLTLLAGRSPYWSLAHMRKSGG